LAGSFEKTGKKRGGQRVHTGEWTKFSLHLAKRKPKRKERGKLVCCKREKNGGGFMRVPLQILQGKKFEKGTADTCCRWPKRTGFWERCKTNREPALG